MRQTARGVVAQLRSACMRGVLRAPPCCRLTRHRRLCDPHHLQGLDRRFEVQGEAVPPFFQYMRSKLVRRDQGWLLGVVLLGSLFLMAGLLSSASSWRGGRGAGPLGLLPQAGRGGCLLEYGSAAAHRKLVTLHKALSCACQSFCPPCLAAQLQVAVGVLESASSYDGSERISVPTQVGGMGTTVRRPGAATQSCGNQAIPAGGWCPRPRAPDVHPRVRPA